MSKIAISPNVSGTGTFTIAAPDSNTDRTLTLPDAGGSVVLNEGSGTFKIDSSGNVGIGTPSPAYALDVQDTGDTVLRVKANSSGAGNDDDAILRLDSAETGEGLIDFFHQGLNEASIQWASSIKQLKLRTGAGTDGAIDFQPNNILAMRVDASGNLAFNSGYGSVAVAYGCRAWVNFNGTGTVAIRGSGNVSSVIDLGVGKYRVNFTTAMQDTNYSVSGVASDTQIFSQGQASTMLIADELATTSVIAGSCYAGSTLYSRDAENVCVAIHR
jgi:hypothetical protein